MRYIFILVVLISLAPPAAPATVYVPDDHPTIQQAIDAAVPHATIVVRPGTYVENISFLGKDIVVRSQFGAAATVIDGNRSGSVVSFTGREPRSAVLEGFTITNGTGTPVGSSGETEGGGVLCFYQCSATIRHNVIRDNEATSGAGIASLFSNPCICGNTIVDNRAALFGGGICCNDFGMPRIISNVIVENSAARGGAMHIALAAPRITGHTFFGNTAPEGGGAVSCILTEDVQITNCIFWGNKSSLGNEILIDLWTEVSISYSALVPSSENIFFLHCHGTLNWGEGMVEVDPLLMSPVPGDYHIRADSPCRDSGDARVFLDFNSDFEGDPRPHLEARDIGADEFHPHLYLRGDPVPGGRVLLCTVGEPSFSGPILLQGTGVRIPPLSTPYGDLRLPLPLAGIFHLGWIPPEGASFVSIDIPAGTQSGDVFFFQALVGKNTPDPVLTNLLAPVIK